ncbi:MAG: hypothetical protein IPJ88_03480 [Myxococcales bacterium]|nr:MAG: hypothetical protein IPJ88_03480 [Myxococcales bacterium]
MKLRALLGLFAFCVLCPLTASAQAGAETMETARGVALGTGMRASAVSTAALLYNPASLSLARLYHVEGSANYVPNTGQIGLMAAAVDSMLNEHFAAGLAAKGIFDNSDDGYSGFDGRLGFGIPIANAVGIGIAARYLTLTDDGVDPAVQSDELAKGFTMDASLRVTLADSFHIAALGYNLIDLESALAPVTVGGAASFQVMDAFSVGTDVLFDLSTYDNAEMQIGGGLELFVQEVMPLRIGYFYDAGLDLHAVTGGIGYVGKMVGMELSLRQQASGGNDTYVMTSFRYFVY